MRRTLQPGCSQLCLTQQRSELASLHLISAQRNATHSTFSPVHARHTTQTHHSSCFSHDRQLVCFRALLCRTHLRFCSAMSVRIAPPPAASSAAAAASLAAAAAASSSAAVAAVYSAPSAAEVAANLAVTRRLRASGFKRLLHSRTPLRDVEDQSCLKRPHVPSIFDSSNATFDLQAKASTASKAKRNYLFTLPFRFSCRATHRTIGTIEQLGTKNPIMYIHFPMVRRGH